MPRGKNGSKQGLRVSAVGLGCSGMSADYGVPDDVESIATIHRCIDLGITMLDTSDAYAAGVNEELVGQAIKGKRDKFLITSKFGNIRGPGGQRGGVNGKPDYVPVACEASLKRLGIDTIDLYYIHRIDPNVPIEDTVGAMARLVQQGKVRHLGLCEAGPNTIRRAHETHPITAIETAMAQIALAWLLARGDNIVPIPGTKRRKYLEENAAAVDITLSDAEVKALEQAFPPQAAAGLRYPEFQLKMMGI